MIKTIIFDQDGTFYSQNHKLARVLRDKTKEWIQKTLKIEREVLEAIYLELPNKYPNPLDGFSSIGLKAKDYIHKVFDKISPSKYLKENKKLISLFKKLEVDLYVVTIASIKYSKRLQCRLGIRKLIKNTYSLGEKYPRIKTKFEIYERIRKKNNLKRKEVLIVGDNYLLDLKYANDKGYPSVLIYNKKNLRKKQLIKIKNIYQLNKIISKSSS